MPYRLTFFACILYCLGCTPKVALDGTPDPALPTTDPKVVVVDYDETADVGVSDRLEVAKTDAAFTFTKVVSDSRCPTGVNCIQAGEAVVLVTLPDGKTRTVRVPAASRQRPNFGVAAGSVSVLKLLPYPENGVKIAPGDYRMTVTVGKAMVD